MTFKELYTNEKLTLKQIAERHGVSIATVFRRLTAEGVKFTSRPMKRRKEIKFKTYQRTNLDGEPVRMLTEKDFKKDIKTKIY